LDAEPVRLSWRRDERRAAPGVVGSPGRGTNHASGVSASRGARLYELLAAAPPFVSHDPSALWHEILHARPVPLVEINLGVHPGLAAVAERCLQKDPAARYRSAAEILLLLDR